MPLPPGALSLLLNGQPSLRGVKPTSTEPRKRSYPTFARPENGSLKFSVGGFRKRYQQWKEIKARCRNGQKPVFPPKKERRKYILEDAQWVEVFKFMDGHPEYTRVKVVAHFKQKGIHFDSGNLAQKLRERGAIERRVVVEAAAAKRKEQVQLVAAQTSRRALRWLIQAGELDPAYLSDDTDATIEETPLTLPRTEQSTPRDLTSPDRGIPLRVDFSGEEGEEQEEVGAPVSSICPTAAPRSIGLSASARASLRCTPSPTTSSENSPSPRSLSQSPHAMQSRAQRPLGYALTAESAQLVLRSKLWDGWLP
ncbi:hypothetical protein NMY22_g18202 [Coprinellus aureogranulatus]|nr:hypothetical protein NMY22_g18202 [Coprinellus aureogranulatus]